MKKLTQIMDIFTLGIGRVIASGYARKNCIPFLATKRLPMMSYVAWNGIEYNYVTHINYEERDKWMENLANEIETAKCEDFNKEDCPNCADQESNAAPGQTTHCRSHQPIAEMLDGIGEEIEETSDKEIASDEEANQWFIERASEFEFHPFAAKCSMCFKREALYIGVTSHGTPFEFCRICRDDLTRRADAAKQSPERIGV